LPPHPLDLLTTYRRRGTLIQIGLFLLAYAFVLAWVFGRWGSRGAWILNAVALGLLALSGAFLMSGNYRPQLSQSRATLCDATSAVPSALFVMGASWLALRVARGQELKLVHRWFLAAAACAVATIPAAIVALWWGVGVLACDTL